MAKCRCESPQWRVIETKVRERAKYRVICLMCEFIWNTNNVKGIPEITEDEKAELEHPYALGGWIKRQVQK